LSEGSIFTVGVQAESPPPKEVRKAALSNTDFKPEYFIIDLILNSG